PASLTCCAQCTTTSRSPSHLSVCPKPRLLKILQAAGAQGETFTLKEVIHYLGQYIMLRELYDKQQQHMVYCGGDVLWELMELETFSVKDPSPVYDMLKRNVTASVVTGRFLIRNIGIGHKFLRMCQVVCMYKQSMQCEIG
uniref:DM2 domain-containing protein n=1 Tax=Sphenodon punctatus TaxID=8508 RepID=A0A8D0H754_SPHPU